MLLHRQISDLTAYLSVGKMGNIQWKEIEVGTIRKLLHPAVMLLCGLAIGAAVRLLDIYTVTLGEIFSRMSVWILLGTLIAIYSPTPKRAMANILPFCLGMLAAYYAVAVITHGVYGEGYIVGWTVFALLSPGMAYLAWLSKEKGTIPGLLRVGILGASVVSTLVLFEGLRLDDLLIDGALVYFLFFKRARR